MCKFVKSVETPEERIEIYYKVEKVLRISGFKVIKRKAINKKVNLQRQTSQENCANNALYQVV